MKTHYSIALTALCVLALLSCNKDNYDKGAIDGGDILVSFDAGSLVAEDQSFDTKVSHNQSGTKHSFAWEDGDQISMVFFNSPGAAGVSSTTHLLNTSNRRFTMDTSTGRFSGQVNTDDLASLSGTGNLNVFAIYPATDLTFTETSESLGGKFAYKASGAVIADTQDGTGIPYCFFTTITPLWSRQYNQFSSGGERKFYLSHALVKFSVAGSTKDITKVEISHDGNYLVGPVQYYIGSSAAVDAATSSAGFRAVQAGGGTKKLTLNNGGTLVASSSTTDLWFACRGIPKVDVTFKFTASDGTYCTAIKKMGAAAYSAGIYNLGTLNLSTATWN